MSLVNEISNEIDKHKNIKKINRKRNEARVNELMNDVDKHIKQIEDKRNIIKVKLNELDNYRHHITRNVREYISSQVNSQRLSIRNSITIRDGSIYRYNSPKKALLSRILSNSSKLSKHAGDDAFWGRLQSVYRIFNTGYEEFVDVDVDYSNLLKGDVDMVKANNDSILIVFNDRSNMEFNDSPYRKSKYRVFLALKFYIMRVMRKVLNSLYKDISVVNEFEESF